MKQIHQVVDGVLEHLGHPGGLVVVDEVPGLHLLGLEAVAVHSGCTRKNLLTFRVAIRCFDLPKI